MGPESLTFVIIAQNEQDHIESCVVSCRELGSVLVVDGGSEDDTVARATSAGAVTISRAFRGYSDQYNFAIDHATTEWVFVLDADERVSEELANEIRGLAPSSDTGAYEVPRRNFFAGQPVDHGGWAPDYNVRLIRPSSCRYEDRDVHARMLVKEGRTGRLTSKITHFSYTGVTNYIAKLNRYTTLELLARGPGRTTVDARSRARALYLRLPARPAVRFLYAYLVKRGYRDGRVGLDIALLSAFYEFVVGAKERWDPVARPSDAP